MNRTRLDCCLPPVACTLAWLLAVIAGSGAAASEPASAAGDAATVRPLIGETTALVIKVDATRLALPQLPDKLKSALPGIEEAYRGWAADAAAGIETLQSATAGQPVYATIGIPRSKSDPAAFVFIRETKAVNQKLVVERLGKKFQGMNVCTRGGLVIATPDDKADLAAALGSIVPSAREGLEDAFQAAGGWPVQVLVLPPDYVRRTVVELMPELPRQLGGGSSDVLTEGLVWAAVRLDPARLRVELIVQSASEEAASRLASHLPKMLRGMYESAPNGQKQVSREMFESLLSFVTPKVEGDRIALRLDQPELGERAMRLLTLAGVKLQDKVRAQGDANRFKQILLAMHSYHDANKVFPPQDELRDKKGRTSLSWRVYLLPYFDQDALYKEFHLDEPWDSAHNKALIEKMPDVYKSSRSGVGPGRTTFLAPVGEDTVFGGEKAPSIQDITDGTSCTVVLVDVKPEQAVPWTAPDDYTFDPKAPAGGLNIGADGRFLAACADGAVHQLRGDIKPELLLWLFRKSDGNAVNWNEVQ